MSRYFSRLLLLSLLSLVPLAINASAQAPLTQKPAGATGEEPDTTPDKPAPVPGKTSSTTGLTDAWQLLDNAIADGKPQLRIDALGALSTLGTVPRAGTLAAKALGDGDRDVRLAAVTAIGLMNNRTLIPDLTKALDDQYPEVSFAAAVALWKMHDHGGENILYQVLAGERKTGPGLISGGLHTANKDLHSPSTLATIGATQGAAALFGPFGIGIDAYEFMHKGNTSGNSARVLTATLLGEDKSETTRAQLIGALGDKDYFVRAGAARALGGFRGKEVSDALLASFADQKTQVRFMCAASYIRVNSPAAAAAKTRVKAAAKH